MEQDTERADGRAETDQSPSSPRIGNGPAHDGLSPFLCTDAGTEPPLPTYKEDNVKRFGQKLAFLNDTGELEYKSFLDSSAFSELARQRGVDEPQQAFSKWIAGCRGKERNVHRWDWLRENEFETLLKALFQRLPWTRSYIATSYADLLRNPLFHALARPMGVGGPQIRHAVHRLCSRDAAGKPTIGYYQLYRPTLSLSDNRSFRARARIFYDEESDSILVNQEYRLKPEPDTVPPRSPIDRKAYPYWNFTGVLLPISDTMHVIVAVADETRLPQVQYFTRYTRQGPHQYLYGWVANVHHGSTFYTAPVVLHRQGSERQLFLDTVHNKIVIDHPYIGDSFSKKLASTVNTLAYHQTDHIELPKT
jgi:hypothetical protein